MASAPPQPNPAQAEAFKRAFAAEAAKRGMTPQQFAEHQKQQIAQEAQKHGMTPEKYIQFMREQAFKQHQLQQQMAAQGQQPPQQGQPQRPQQHLQQIVPGTAPKPEAIALAKWMRSQDLKSRTCILDSQRKDMFKVKRALRALQSDAYEKACKKNKLLPQVTDDASAERAFKLLPMSLLALRVSKIDPPQTPGAKRPKHVKGLWTVKLEQQQDCVPDMHYVWLYTGPQWKVKLIAGGAFLGVMALVLFPLWPLTLRIGVWYLSMGLLGLIALFFAMAIFRLILFCITYFAVPPGLWLYPNLFEDVGFFDSFRPLWGWQEDVKQKKKKAKKTKKSETPSDSNKSPEAATATATTTSAEPIASSAAAIQRDLKPRVEEVEEE
ncbi:MAG: Translocation protein S62 [Cirrosporium novae-zelandiae]|nr:MAG: Translocation protein S62 [Cirrosporium novae-zelandiae]